MTKDRDFAQRATAHVRAKTGHNLIVNFANNGASDEEKVKMYAFLYASYRKKDYSAFEGQIAQAQAAVQAEEKVEEKPAPRKPKREQPVIEVEAEATPEPEVWSGDERKAQADFVKTLRALVGQPAPSKVEVDEAMVVRIVAEHMAGAEKKVLDFSQGAMETAHKMVVDYLKMIPPRAVVEIKPLIGDKFEIERQHYKFPLLMACLAQRIPVCMTGPAGSGKSQAAQSASKALGLPFGSLNFGPTTSKADLFGYKDANGNYHSTELVRTALDGGVFCGDEVDNSHAGALVQMNMPLANRIIPTPDGTKAVHPDWVPVFAANTFGTGANRMYVGRNQLDAATLDRLAFIEWDYDEGLEGHIIGLQGDSPAFDLAEGGTMSAEDWLKIVRGFRRVVAQLGIRHLVTPRAAIYGAKLLKAGVGVKHVQDLVLIKGLDAESINKVKAALKL